jgi:hypothetical protein
LPQRNTARRRRPVGRRLSLLAATLAAVAAATVLLVDGGSSRSDGRHASPSATPTDATFTKQVPAAKPCENTSKHAPCSALTVQGRTIEYALVPAARATRRTVLVDFGGPGLSILPSPQTLISSFVGEERQLHSSANLLFVQEPWTGAAHDVACDSALSAFYVALHSGGQATQLGQAVTDSCALGHDRYGFTPSGYESAVVAILDAQHLNLDGFVGSSYASERLGYLRDPAPKWAILLRPYPLAATGQAIARSRAAAIQRFTTQLKLPLRTISGAQSIPGRSVTVTPFDQQAALAELAYVPSAQRARLARAAMLGRPADAIGRLSDAYWTRYGTNSISLALLAVLDEACTNTSWAARYESRLEALIAAPYQVCREQSQPPIRRPVNGRVCVVTAPSDLVIPGTLDTDALLGFTPAFRLASGNSDHGSLDGLDRCLKRLAIPLEPSPSPAASSR